MTVSELIKQLEILNPNAPIVIDKVTEYSEVDMVMPLENAIQAYPGSRSWMDGDPGDGGVTCYVLR